MKDIIIALIIAVVGALAFIWLGLRFRARAKRRWNERDAPKRSTRWPL